MKKSNIALIAAVALSAAGFFSSVNAADTATTVDAGGKKGGCPTGNCGPGKGGFKSSFGFTDAQLEKMNSLKLDFEKANGPKKAELHSLSKELRDEITKPGVSKSQLLSLQSKINEIKAELSINKVSLMADRIALMTDDQKAKIRSFALKRSSFGNRGGHGKGGHFRGGKKFHGRSHGGPGGSGGRSFRGDKPAAIAPAPADAPAAAPSEV